MEAIKKLAGAYLVGISIVVAVFFIINLFLVGAISVLAVWHVLDVLMLVGLALGMGFNYAHKIRVGGREAGDQVSRGYLEANVAFYTTTVITILFLHNWFAFLVTGDVSQGDNHTAWASGRWWTLFCPSCWASPVAASGGRPPAHDPG